MEEYHLHGGHPSPLCRGDFPNPAEYGMADARPLKPQPRIIMNNPNESHTQPFQQADDEPRIRDYAMATVLVVTVCAGIAISFTAIVTCHAADDVLKRIFRKGGRHAPK